MRCCLWRSRGWSSSTATSRRSSGTPPPPPARPPGGGRPPPLRRPRADLRAPLAARGRAAPVRRALLGCVVVALALPAQALAHASLVRVSPGYGARLAEAPRQVELHFDQGVTLIPNSVRIYAADG